MKVLNLQCEAGHGFEGWFGSEADFVDQQQRDLIACPVCGGSQVQRMPSAPRLNLSGAREPAPATAKSSAAAVSPTPAGAAQVPARQLAEAAYLQAVRHLLRNTEDVGPRFAEEARRIHYGEVEHRHIRGQTSSDEVRELHDEGIEVFNLPIPAGLDGPLQ
ncbi:protein of unknown function DUF1178 [Leptothrix cholodnii SP-6]|uniref:Uncharacterized protein n=1 Tax=Leptothrix cholodnii (strain ATCC 51168 / LMG 8142 / SP-6) TaxID=395495 RepID=B1XWB6_LEPCP|nr:DUF1178 family protein [Leptothrix cholodnii]ACB33784.1 protein of unknown function DUF1178 [Leptothrix cholodnii SP-6]